MQYCQSEHFPKKLTFGIFFKSPYCEFFSANRMKKSRFSIFFPLMLGTVWCWYGAGMVLVLVVTDFPWTFYSVSIGHSVDSCRLRRIYADFRPFFQHPQFVLGCVRGHLSDSKRAPQLLGFLRAVGALNYCLLPTAFAMRVAKVSTVSSGQTLTPRLSAMAVNSCHDLFLRCSTVESSSAAACVSMTLDSLGYS